MEWWVGFELGLFIIKADFFGSGNTLSVLKKLFNLLKDETSFKSTLLIIATNGQTNDKENGIHFINKASRNFKELDIVTIGAGFAMIKEDESRLLFYWNNSELNGIFDMHLNNTDFHKTNINVTKTIASYNIKKSWTRLQ